MSVSAGQHEEQSLAVHDMFKMIDDDLRGELNVRQIQSAHEMIRMGGISIPQVKASMLYTCIDPEVCEEFELLDLLKEMDRRYYLIQDFRWEFSMLDTEAKDTISEDQARWFIQSVHGQHFSRRKWESFIKSRPAPGTQVSFAEIEVELCNIPCLNDVIEEQEEERRRKAERNLTKPETTSPKIIINAVKQPEEEKRKKLDQEERKRRKDKLDEERQRMLEDQQGLQDERAKQEAAKLAELKKAADADKAKEAEAERLRQEAEDKKRKEEERERRRQEREAEDARRHEEEERLERLRLEAEEKRKRAEEEAKNIEVTAKMAADAEAEAEKAADEAKEALKRADDSKSKKELEEKEAEARKRQREMKEKKIRANLKVAIKTRKRQPLKTGVQEFKKAKLDDYDGDVPVAEQLLKLADAKERLKNAMAGRQLKQLEDAMSNVRKHGFEEELQPEMIEAHNLLLRLRRLERIRAEILELKQSTVAEIRSYSSPPQIVHSVMIGTFLILGHLEKETKEWKKVQALVGKTGKEGLKRRCLEYDPQTLANKMEIAVKAKDKMSAFELDDVRDVSAGAATFYLWASNMIEEAEMIENQKTRDAQDKEKGDDDTI